VSQQPQRTLGVDLASDPKNTAVCVVRWSEQAFVEKVVKGVTDERILALVDECDVTGIDSPFGWPTEFVAHLSSHHAGGETTRASWSKDLRERLSYRRTDYLVKDVMGRWPLSVSTNQIAVPALRCSGLLRRLGVVDRSGDGRVFEVYPAVALVRWGVPQIPYKGRNMTPESMSRLREELCGRAPWLRFEGATYDQIVNSDDEFDALVAALAARAASLGFSSRPSPDDRELAAREGWIAVPDEGSLRVLCAGQR